MNVPARRASGRAKQRLRLWLRLLRASRFIESDVRELLKSEFSTTLPRFDALAALDRNEQGLMMSELSRELEVSNGNVTGIVERLVTDGLVVRTPAESDRRVTRVRLSKRGRKAFARMANAHQGWIDHMLRGFSNDETLQLIGLLDKLKLKMEARR
ncbi:MAG: MarR family transcriptional regulator [Gammaproteobacteria bacterium]|nr:MarR family transcriptional regulator [Gammaproteobacteria bacterium]